MPALRVQIPQVLPLLSHAEADNSRSFGLKLLFNFGVAAACTSETNGTTPTEWYLWPRGDCWLEKRSLLRQAPAALRRLRQSAESFTIAHRKTAKKICEFYTRHKAFVVFSVDDRARSAGKRCSKRQRMTSLPPQTRVGFPRWGRRKTFDPARNIR